jgi:hypothetical protein
VDDNVRVETVGVSLEPEAQNPQVPLFLTGREVAARVRAFISSRLTNRSSAAPERNDADEEMDDTAEDDRPKQAQEAEKAKSGRPGEA